MNDEDNWIRRQYYEINITRTIEILLKKKKKNYQLYYKIEL